MALPQRPFRKTNEQRVMDIIITLRTLLDEARYVDAGAMSGETRGHFSRATELLRAAEDACIETVNSGNGPLVIDRPTNGEQLAPEA